jgi:AbrB family looped-hinge helix DNA binding protein
MRWPDIFKEPDIMPTNPVSTRLSKEGRVLIPVELRNLLGLKPDDTLTVYEKDGEIRLFSRREGIRRAQAIAAKFKTPGVSVVDELIRERREEAAREEAQVSPTKRKPAR